MSPEDEAQPFTNHVTRTLAELRDTAGAIAAELSTEQRADMERLFAANAALDELLANRDLAEDTRRHDIFNVLGAMRGYAEMLAEDLAERFPTAADMLERVVKAVTVATQADTAKSPSADTRTIPNSDMQGTILAVDDNADNRELLTRYLQRSGHQVIVAASGMEALARLADRQVDVVLLDLIMPGMDGNQVLRRLKESEDLRSIPVIVISGRQDLEGILDCIEAGADDYLFKPFNPVLLQARIKAGLERKRWHDKEEKYRRQLERNEKFIRATFGRYVSDEIVENLLEEPEGLKLGGDLRQVTMLMSDIREFSSLCERLTPEQVMKMLNNYLGVMTDIILRHQGTIDEFIGDAILAIFGAPVQRDDDADRAVQCALDMQRAMIDINRENRRAGLPEISMGIGVNTGDVITGNIGSEKRSKYGVVGHHVNLTARIESQTAGGDILISDSTLDNLALPVEMGDSLEVQVKGIHDPVTMHRIIDNRQSKSRAS